MKKKISTQQTAANIARMIDILKETPNRLESLSSSLTEGQLRQPLGNGERSLIQDLSHPLNTGGRAARLSTSGSMSRIWRRRLGGCFSPSTE